MNTLQFANNNKIDEKQIIEVELLDSFISYFDVSPTTIDKYRKSTR